MTATDSDTSGWNAAPSSGYGLTSVASAPAMKPGGSKMMIAGIRSWLASTCEPAASTGIKPTLSKTWSVVTANPPSRAAPGRPHRPPLPSPGKIYPRLTHSG
jgi:hypothetical protein